MLLDGLAMIFLLFLMISVGVIAMGTYLLLVSENMNKTEEERRLEDKEQIEYLRNYKNKGKIENVKKDN